MKLKIKLLNNNCIPYKKYKNDAGYDLKARIKKLISLSQHQTILIPTGVCVEIPEGYVGDIRPRSSLSKEGVTAEYGTIDSGYTGEINIVLTNNSDTPYHIHPYDRVAQLVIVPIAIIDELEITNTLSDSERNSNGFGSTGK